MHNYAIAMKCEAVLKPLTARLACCSSPFIASTYALMRLSSMPRTTPSIRCFKVTAHHHGLKGLRLDSELVPFGFSHLVTSVNPLKLATSLACRRLQHHLGGKLRTPRLASRCMRGNQSQKLRPRNHQVHLIQEFTLTRALDDKLESGGGKAD